MATTKSSTKLPGMPKKAAAKKAPGKKAPGKKVPPKKPMKPSSTVVVKVGKGKLTLAQVKARAFNTLLYVDLQALDDAQMGRLNDFILQIQASPIVICETLGLPPPITEKKPKKK